MVNTIKFRSSVASLLNFFEIILSLLITLTVVLRVVDSSGLECDKSLMRGNYSSAELFPIVERLLEKSDHEENNWTKIEVNSLKSVMEIPDNKALSIDNTLELVCTDLFYPVQWGFQKYQLYAAWTATTGREFVGNSTQEIYKAWLRYRSIRNLTQLRDDFPTCHRTNDACLQTSVSVGRGGKQLVITKASKYELKPDAEFGKNPNCSIRLAYDEETQTFYCQAVIPGINVTMFPRPCSDPVTCASVYQNPEKPCPSKPIIRIGECNAGHQCAKLTYASDFLPSVAVCLVRGSADDSVAAPFFYSLSSNTRYLNWKDAKPEEMMTIKSSEIDLFAGEKITFSCNASYYYFGSGMHFELHKLQPEGFNDNTTSSEVITAADKILYQATTGKGVETQIPIIRSLTVNRFISVPGSYKVTCKAPVWNSTEWISKSEEIIVRESTKPVFSSGNITETLYYKPDSKLNCLATGTPKPELVWTLNDGPLPSIIQSFVGEQNKTNSWITLRFPNTNQGVYGNFTCRASSPAGISEKTFIIIPNDKSSSSTMIVIAILGVLGLLLVPAVIFLFWKVRNQKKQLRYLTQDEVDEFLLGKPDYIPFQCDMSTYAYYLPYDTTYEIAKEDLRIDFNKLLGSGAYGLVIFGHYQNRVTGESKEIAIKTSKPMEDGIEFFKALLSELKIMTYLDKHENLVNLVGACTQNIQKREVFIALEFCENGSLLSYLRTNRHTFLNPCFQADGKIPVSRQPSFLDHPQVQYVRMEDLTHISIVNQHDYANINRIGTTDLLRWAHQIAEGMRYLASKKVIHGDLSARNILLTRDLTAKVGDFGLSKRLMHYSSYTRTATTPLPIKWLAIECLQDFQFSAESDIWSYGVALWELFSLGEIPYSGFNGSGEEFLKSLSRGMRLTQPIFCTPEIFDVMMSCWKSDRKLRPTFAVLSYFFKKSLETPADFAHPIAALRLSGAIRNWDEINGNKGQPLRTEI